MLHEEIDAFARNRIKELLGHCTEDQIHLFKRMYSHKDLSKDIDAVVDDMPEDKLNHALSQITRALDKGK